MKKLGIEIRKNHLFIIILLLYAILTTGCSVDKNKKSTKNKDFHRADWLREAKWGVFVGSAYQHEGRDIPGIHGTTTLHRRSTEHHSEQMIGKV